MVPALDRPKIWHAKGDLGTTEASMGQETAGRGGGGVVRCSL